jgi:hypothetical protein
VADEVGCRGIVTGAYRDRIGWYAKYGFVPIEGGAEDAPQRMFLDLRTVRASLVRVKVGASGFDEAGADGVTHHGGRLMDAQFFENAAAVRIGCLITDS